MFVTDESEIPSNAKSIEITDNGFVYELDDDMDHIYVNKSLLKARSDKKKIRTESVKRITITTTAGNTFDGDETSQDRMTRAITAMEGLPAETTTLWVLSNNTAAQVTRDELKEALLLAGQAQSNLWVIE